LATIAWSMDPDEIWQVAGWAFRRVLDDIVAQYPDDLEMTAVLSDLRDIKGLSVDLLEPELATRVTEAIRHVATGILSGSIKSGIGGDANTVQEYMLALEELLAAIPRDRSADSS
jgi:hypothetical protein